MIKQRVKELRWVKASSLIPNVKNWRVHTKAQTDAMQAILKEVGFAGALIARDTPNGIELIDGELRRNISGNELLPVLIVDLDDSEADLLLSVYDPLAAMASSNKDKLIELLGSIQTDNQAIQDLLEAVANDERRPFKPIDPNEEWQGMPEFESKDIEGAAYICIVRFLNEDDIKDFEGRLGYKLQHKGNTYSTWYPYKDFNQGGRGLAFSDES